MQIDDVKTSKNEHKLNETCNWAEDCLGNW